jgi:hypothetical protein
LPLGGFDHLQGPARFIRSMPYAIQAAPAAIMSCGLDRSVGALAGTDNHPSTRLLGGHRVVTGGGDFPQRSSWSPLG